MTTGALRLRLSPSRLTGFVACPHLAQLELSVARGERERPVFADAHADLLRRKGAEHEAALLARLEAAGRSVVRIAGFGEDPDAAQRTEAAIRAGAADYIYQAYLVDGVWHGYADFLERQQDGSYEPVEAKLARAARPEHLLQLCFYAEQIERITGRPPEHVHVELGSGVRESFRTAEYLAYYRRVRGRFLAATESAPATYPWPCDHCPVCVWRRECRARLVADDHLVLVADLGRAHVERLGPAGIATLEDLGEAAPGTSLDDMRAETFERLRHQAELQLHHRRTGKHRVDHLPVEEGRGFLLLPAPSPGDVWMDFEDHPFFEPAGGLEYLFGYCWRDGGGELRYEALWATDRASEKRQFETLVDWIAERRRRFPDMHVYHYADHERSTLRRLMGAHGTREEAIDDFLRGEVLVDLYRVTRQALRASVESYSIKRIETLYGQRRLAEVEGGRESTVLFERWLECGDDALLLPIERYNEEDCRSTAALHGWLLEERPQELAWRPPPGERESNEKARTLNEERERVRAMLFERSTAASELLAELMEYHRREQRPEWWEYFEHRTLDDEDLIRNSQTLGGLTLVGDPVPDKQSLVYALAFPPQDHKIREDGVDPITECRYDVEVDDERCQVRLWRGLKRAHEPLPRALVPPGPIQDPEQRAALLRFARSHLAGDGRHPALEAVLERRPPRVDLSLPPPDAALTLADSYLLVQGPPGTGKTWQGAKAAVALMRAGRRIGVTSLGHKAIDKLLSEIEREAAEQGFAFRGLKKHSKEADAYAGTRIGSSANWRDLLDPELNLIAGTGWLFAREPFDGHVDTLFIDEAGQVSLADAIAAGTAARNLILLGDPNQLPQVSKGAHPPAARASVLRHLLGEHATVPPELGVFLAETWRLRPEACAFTSEAYYEGRLVSAPVCARRSIAGGDGLFLTTVQHEGRGQASREEAVAVAAQIERLLGTPFVDAHGVRRTLGPEDVLVVAPYNAQVRALRARIPAGVRVGTVDKFQGQEAPVVFVSFASSSGADAPRGIAFAFDRHRVNVATSRAQCRVVLVCAPRLLEAECARLEHMRLMNAVCRFAELARAPQAAQRGAIGSQAVIPGLGI